MKFTITLFLYFGILPSLFSQTIRPVRDSVGFCWDAKEMNNIISFLEKDSQNIHQFQNKNLVAAISPHDDYLYAGRIYFPLYKLISAKEIIIFGVTHGTVRRAMNDPKNVLIFDNFDYWQGPYGLVKPSPLRELLKNKLNPIDILISNKAQRIEHSIEALIPFLQYYNRNIKITPIMVTEMPFQKMQEISAKLSGVIYKYIYKNHLKPGKDIFFLISNDADHYGKDFDNIPFGTDLKAHKSATDNDKRIIRKYLNRKIDENDLLGLTTELWENNGKKPLTLWCGRYPVVFGLMTTSKIIKKLTGGYIYGKLFKYSDTFTEKVLSVKNVTIGTTAPFSLKHWVGFFSAGFYIDK